MRILHIIATPRRESSNTFAISQSLIANLQQQHANVEIDELDVFQTPLPPIGGANLDAKYTLMAQQSLDAARADAWAPVETLVKRFLAADRYVITSPMWNFGVPYALKHLIDVVVQPGYLFKYNEHGYPVGLVQGRSAVCVSSRGGDYSPGSPLNALDFQEPYLRTILGFIGITQVDFITAQPMDITPDARGQALAQAASAAKAYQWPAHVAHT